MTTEAVHEPDSASAFPDRVAVTAALAGVLERSGSPWAWQGASQAHDEWVVDSGPGDLDVWWHPTAAQRAAVVRELVAGLGGAVVATARTPGRLMHLGIAFLVPDGLALVDLTEGDLRVGPVLMVPAGQVALADHRLVGVAGAADMALRPVLRGRLPKAERLAQARAAWSTADDDARGGAVVLWRSQLGGIANDVAAMLSGGEPDPGLPRRARIALARATLAPTALPTAWAQRHAIVPAGRHAGPLGLRTHGVVVALVGTDGSGKSTVARNVRNTLVRAGFQTSQAYFGMAHGNLPGVSLARKVLGIAAAGDRAAHDDGAPAAPAQAHADASATVLEESMGAPSRPADHAGLRQAAAWFYAAEYQWRYWRHVAPARRRGAVVICDRYVYDLRDSPWPGSPAARVAQWLMPAPDLLVLPDAPAELIHARKPERSLSEQAAQQASFRQLLGERPARVAELVVDTSGATPNPELAVVAAVVAAAHDPLRRREDPAGLPTG